MKELDKLITEMRGKEIKFKKYIFTDRSISAIWSFNTEEELNEFLNFYLKPCEMKNCKSYNNGRYISLHSEE